MICTVTNKIIIKRAANAPSTARGRGHCERSLIRPAAPAEVNTAWFDPVKDLSKVPQFLSSDGRVI